MTWAGVLISYSRSLTACAIDMVAAAPVSRMPPRHTMPIDYVPVFDATSLAGSTELSRRTFLQPVELKRNKMSTTS